MKKSLTIINIGIVVYFVAIYTINFFQIDLVIVGIFRELLTIPLILAEIVFLFLSVRFFVQENKFSVKLVFSTLALAICSIITVWSFF